MNLKNLSPEERDVWLELSDVDPAIIGRFAFGDTDTLWVATVGLDWASKDYPALTTVVANAMTGEIVHNEDPIEALVENHAPWSFSPERAPVMFSGDEAPAEELEIEAVSRAIAALQSGLDRLKAHAAFRKIRTD